MYIVLINNTVIDWNKGTDFNKGGVAGFNVGSDATVNFTGAFGVLNIDSTGNPSQIFGTLTGAGNVYVANTNGIIVGATGKISSTSTGQVGLIANTRVTVAFDGTASTTSIEYLGDGGDVTVAKGAAVSGTSVLVSGGGTVNVDLSTFTGGALTLNAGVKNSTNALADDNTNAVLTATGNLGGATLADFASAGDASVNGTLTLGAARVDGTLTNTGALTLDTGFAIDGGLVNGNTVAQADAVSMGSLVNNGVYDGATFDLTTTDGGIANSGSMTGLGAVVIQHGGDFANDGNYASSGVLDVYGSGDVTNNGVATATGIRIREGGNFTNAGEMTLDAGAGDLVVLNGNVINSGTLGAGALTMASDSGAGLGFTKGADYSVVNTGTVTSAASLAVIANLHQGTTANDSTGSFTNTGNLRVGSAGDLAIAANDDINLAGNVQAKSGATYQALSAANSLTNFSILAGGSGFGPVLATDGAAIIATDVVASGLAAVIGNQAKLMSDISVVDATGAPAGSLVIVAGNKQSADYAVRVASGKTMTAGTIGIGGDQAGHEPNVIVQGALSAGKINLGAATLPVSDVYTGPGGSLLLHDNGFGVSLLNIAFTGVVKTVPYNNSATNFRFNGLNVMTDGSPLALGLNPVAYLTNGTSNGLSAVNLLVNGDINLFGAPVVAPVAAGDSAVTGVTNIPNTHLVLQSSGKIATAGNFYWPGYVYLGNVMADADGNALPGTLGLGTITTGGDFNNVLPGDIAGASGIHFITQFPLTLGGDLVTNANAWVNFGTDPLTRAYSTDTLASDFFGGTQGPGTVINYGPLDESRFHTAPPSSVR
jgi:filamentous hemagglutinin family protein